MLEIRNLTPSSQTVAYSRHLHTGHCSHLATYCFLLLPACLVVLFTDTLYSAIASNRCCFEPYIRPGAKGRSHSRNDRFPYVIESAATSSVALEWKKEYGSFVPLFRKGSGTSMSTPSASSSLLELDELLPSFSFHACSIPATSSSSKYPESSSKSSCKRTGVGVR